MNKPVKPQVNKADEINRWKSLLVAHWQLEFFFGFYRRTDNVSLIKIWITNQMLENRFEKGKMLATMITIVKK